MLFDLRGKRKRFIQVIYAALALLMGVGLVGFGIGSDASGGLFTCNGGQHSAATRNLENRADELEAQTRTNPEDKALLLELARARIQAANSESEADPQTGAQSFSAEGVQQLEKAADTWETYLKLEPKPPSDEVASLIANGYFALAQSETDLNQAVANLEGAAEAERIVTDARPSQGTFAQLATYLYLAGREKAGAKAEKRALAEAESSQRSLIKEQLKQSKRIGRELKEQLEQQAELSEGQPGANPLDNPLGGLGSSGGLSGGGTP